jgi:hypothetical protein
MTIAPVSVSLAATAAAPGIARYRTRLAGTTAALPEELVHSAALIAGELVGISIRQSRSAVQLGITVHADCIEIQVREPASCLVPRAGGLGSTRSMELVRRLAQSWGLDRGDSGRILWAIASERASDALRAPASADAVPRCHFAHAVAV